MWSDWPKFKIELSDWTAEFGWARRSSKKVHYILNWREYINCSNYTMLWKNLIPANIQNKHTHTYIYIYMYTALLWYIAVSAVLHQWQTNIFPQHCCNWSFPFQVFSPFEVCSSSYQMELHRFLNWKKTHSGKHQLNS